MWLLPVLFPTKVIDLNAVENDVNLRTKAGNPPYPLLALFRNTANKGSSSAGTPAMRTGTGWMAGTLIYLVNQATIQGFNGSTGSSGTPNSGAGVGGNGGRGSDQSGTPASAPGSAGGQGVAGGPGGPGTNGGPAFTADAVTGVRILVNNSAGSIIAGAAGPGGVGGTGGPGGGGGGGGGD